MADRAYLNWPFLSDEHRVLAQSLKNWTSQNLSSDHDESDVDGTCKDLVQKLADGNWLNFAVTSEYGGVNEKLDIRSLCLIREHLGYEDALADFSFVMQGLGSGSIGIAGSKALKSDYLPAVAKGQKIAAFALSEPNAGSDVAAISTTADESGDEYILNGCKTWISNGGIADFYTVFARTGEAPGSRGLSAFVVDADNPGLKIANRIDVTAPHPLATIEFNDCRVPKSHLLGNPGEGFKIAMSNLDIFRPTVGAAALGFARRAHDEALKHAATREIFDGKLADLQLIQEKLADMALDIDASALLIYRAAWQRDTGTERITKEAAMAKLYATESAQLVIDKAIQILGGLGVVKDSPVEKLYREVRALRIYEGASEVQKVIIARQVLRELEATD